MHILVAFVTLYIYMYIIIKYKRVLLSLYAHRLSCETENRFSSLIFHTGPEG